MKVVPYGATKPMGGFLSSIRANMRATPTEIVSGCCAGRVGIVSPLAGTKAVALDELLASDEEAASEIASQVLDELSSLDRSQRQVALSTFGADYLKWAKAQNLLEAHGVDVPDGSLPIHETVVQVHGDLHLGNVLVMAGQPPCIIDFDSQFVGSATVDPLMLSLGPFFHRSGSQRTSEWHVAAVVAVFNGAEGIDTATRWARRGYQYCVEAGLLRREFWAALLLYCAKQLKYEDVTSDLRLKQLAVALAQLAVERLRSS